MSQLSAIGLTKSYTKIKAIDGFELNSFWSLNYSKLKERISKCDIYTSLVSGRTIEIPENIYICHADNYAKTIFGDESVLKKKFADTLDSMTVMVNGDKIPDAEGFTRDYLRKCADENKDPIHACVKFSSEEASRIKDYIRNTGAKGANIIKLNSVIGEIKDSQLAHLRDFIGLPSVPVKSSVHAEVIQIFHILCNILFKTDDKSNNRFILCPNDPEFTLQMLKFAITNHDTIKNCVLTLPPFHINGHLLKIWMLKTPVLVLLIGPFYEAIDFKPSVFGIGKLQEKLRKNCRSNQDCIQGLYI